MGEWALFRRRNELDAEDLASPLVTRVVRGVSDRVLTEGTEEGKNYLQLYRHDF